jgi:SAM-dependent methyltransferase
MRHEEFAAHARVEDHHWWFTARRQILLALLRRVAPPGSPVVDIGCGTGGNAAAFHAAGHRVVGVDVSEQAIAYARERFPQVRFALSDAPMEFVEALRPDGTAVLTDVLEHVDDDRALLEAAITAVPAGGHLFLTVPADASLWSPHDVAFGHRRRYELEEFRQLWQGLGVSERLLSPYNSRLYPPIALIRRLARGSALRPGGDLDLPSRAINALLRRTFAGERHRLVAALDRGVAPYRRGISLLAVLRKS